MQSKSTLSCEIVQIHSLFRHGFFVKKPKSKFKVPIAANWKGVCLQNTCKPHSYHLNMVYSQFAQSHFAHSQFAQNFPVSPILFSPFPTSPFSHSAQYLSCPFAASPNFIFAHFSFRPEAISPNFPISPNDHFALFPQGPSHFAQIQFF